MKIDVEGHATIDINIEGMDYRTAYKLLQELRRLDSMLPDPMPQQVQMFMDALDNGLRWIDAGYRLYEDEEL